MTKRIVLSATALGIGLLVQAASYKVCDFEDFEIGRKFQLTTLWGEDGQATATVEADPSNPSNKVLHVKLGGVWNVHPDFILPDEIAGKALTDKYRKISLRLYRHPSDQHGQWYQVQVHLGDDQLYCDDGYPDHGPAGQWSALELPLSAAGDGNASNVLRVGIQSDKADYYIDDIVIRSDFEVIEGGKIDINNPSSTASDYSTYSDGINIPEGTSLDLYTSRYTRFTSQIIGSGRLNIHGAGERVYLSGENGTPVPDWSGYDGDVHIYPWPEGTTATAGNYGVVLGPGSYKFGSDDIKTSLSDKAYTPLLENNYLTVHPGATVAAHGNNTARAFRIGRLALEEGATLMGHIKKSNYRIYYIVGRSGEDSELAGTIANPQGNDSPLGIVKEGAGTYRITGNNNWITGQVSVIGGNVLIDNDAAEARSKRLPGAVGCSAGQTGVVVYTGGAVGGTGHISGLTDVYGHLEPGNEAPGILTIADFANDKAADLRVHPTTRLIFKTLNAGAYDRLDVSGAVALDPRKENLAVSGTMPIVEIRLPQGHDLKVGDTFTLLNAKTQTAPDGKEWKFRVQYPKAYTWEVAQGAVADGYAVVAKVTALEYSGQGDKVYEDEYGETLLDNEDYMLDYTIDNTDTRTLRELAAKAGKEIGLAVRGWSYNFSNPNDQRGSIAAREFNVVVAENEMKIDATEPSEGRFALDNANNLINFANANSQVVRGHTLVWHQQVPSWISSDGKKNSNKFSRDRLLEIMRNHINGVAGTLKGKVREWDVVNECLDDDQSVVRNDPNGFKLRNSVWHDGIGADFIKQAFEMAHEADPDALLFLNDYGVEFMGHPKAEALYNLAKSLVEAGVPIHGVGLQCHITTGELQAKRLADNIRRYADLGLLCIITELDIAQANPNAPDAAARQAREYSAVVNAALSQPNCPTVMVWGLADHDSWRQNNPLLWDSGFAPKEAYYAVRATLAAIADKAGVEEIPAADTEREVKTVTYYNLQGCRVNHATASGLVIKHTVYTDGSSSTVKVMLR